LVIGHQNTKNYQEEFERKVQHQVAIDAAFTLKQKVTVYGEELEKVEVFKYLIPGHVVSV